MSNFELVGSTTVACLLDLPRREVQRLVERGELHPVQKLPGRTGAYLFDPADVDRLVQERAS